MRIIIAFLLMTGLAYAGPFLASDANDGASEYLIECDGGVLPFVSLAALDGSLYYDLGLWASGGGWYNCTAKASDTYEVVDETTGAVTNQTVFSDPAPFRLKIPMNVKPQNYQVK
jgi:hypothetical protein